ncbi:MAG: RimK family alpha-L-glutamate ligase [Bacilli bacterium]
MKALIITNKTIKKSQYKIDRLIYEGRKLNIDFDIKINDGTLAFIDEQGLVNVSKIKAYSFVIYLDKDFYLASLISKAKIPIFTDGMFLHICNDKGLTYLYGLNHQIPLVKTIFAPLRFNELDESDLKILDFIEKELSYPYIMKKSFSSLGEGVYLIDNKQTAINEYKKHYKDTLIFQQFIESSVGRSLRVLIIDGQIFGAIIRRNDNDFRSNFLKGTYSEIYNLNNEEIEIINNIIKVYNIKYAGLDFLFDKNDKILLLEINSNALFYEFEKTTNKNVALEYLKMCIKYI